MKPIIYCTSIIAATTALLFCSIPALAQDDGPSKRQGVEYIRISFTDYKADQRNEARRIIAEHFVPAGDKAGTPGPMLTIHFQTGEWDTINIWALEEGMADLEWTSTSSPNFVKWKAALDEQAGGEDEGWEIYNRYFATIARRRSEVGHHHVSDEE